MKKKLGARGEELAANYLVKKGYQIIQRNYYTRYGELDIISKKDNILIFVEVKTRTSTSFGLPEESVTKVKMDHLRKAALIYLNNLNQGFREIRFDVIAILIKDNHEEITHIENAF